MSYVVVEIDGKHTVIYGPFILEKAAHVYAGKLAAHAPHKSYQVTYLTPEKNLPKSVD